MHVGDAEWDVILLLLSGLLIPVMGGLWAIWWRVESRQDKKIDDLAESNRVAHEILYGKLDKVRDKIEDIWKHLGSRHES